MACLLIELIAMVYMQVRPMLSLSPTADPWDCPIGAEKSYNQLFSPPLICLPNYHWFIPSLKKHILDSGMHSFLSAEAFSNPYYEECSDVGYLMIEMMRKGWKAELQRELPGLTTSGQRFTTLHAGDLGGTISLQHITYR